MARSSALALWGFPVDTDERMPSDVIAVASDVDAVVLDLSLPSDAEIDAFSAELERRRRRAERS